MRDQGLPLHHLQDRCQSVQYSRSNSSKGGGKREEVMGKAYILVHLTSYTVELLIMDSLNDVGKSLSMKDTF